MENMCLDEILSNIYTSRVSYINDKNNEAEKEYFLENSIHIPFGHLLSGTNYHNLIESFKRIVKKSSRFEVERVYMLLSEVLLFSSESDIMFKNKLKADSYISDPMKEFVYPELRREIRSKYGDTSSRVIVPNSLADVNVTAEISRLVYLYTETVSFLYKLYCHNFNLPDGFDLFTANYPEIYAILENSSLTVGDFMRALIRHKCNIIKDVLSEVPNLELREHYMQEIKALKAEKYKEVEQMPIKDKLITSIMDSGRVEDPAEPYTKVKRK